MRKNIQKESLPSFQRTPQKYCLMSFSLLRSTKEDSAFTFSVRLFTGSGGGPWSGGSDQTVNGPP